MSGREEDRVVARVGSTGGEPRGREGSTEPSEDGGLPMVEAGESGMDGPPHRRDVSSFRLVLTLAVAGAVAGFVIVLVHQWAQPRIDAHQARVLREAIFEVLGGPEEYETAFLVDGGFTTDPPATADTAGLERVYVGYDEAGRPVGIAVAGAEPGFQDFINLIFGYLPGRDEVVGMKVLDNKETPGLGDKIEKDSSFLAEFAGVGTPLVGVKPRRATGAENEVDMITGATISSQAVVDIINHRLEDLEKPLNEFWARAPVARGGGL